MDADLALRSPGSYFPQRKHFLTPITASRMEPSPGVTGERDGGNEREKEKGKWKYNKTERK